MEEKKRAEEVDKLLQRVNSKRGPCFATFVSETYLEKGWLAFALRTIQKDRFGVSEEDLVERDRLLQEIDPKDRDMLPQDVVRLIR